jgi:hypothetical protein
MTVCVSIVFSYLKRKIPVRVVMPHSLVFRRRTTNPFMTTEDISRRKISSEKYTTAAEVLNQPYHVQPPTPHRVGLSCSFSEHRGATANISAGCATRAVSPGSIALRCSRIISGLSALHSNGGNSSASLHGSVHRRRAQRARPCRALVGHLNVRSGRRHPRRRFRRPRQRRGRSTGAGDPGPRPGMRGLGLLHGMSGTLATHAVFFLLRTRLSSQSANGCDMKVINHGVPEELKEAAMETCRELFSLPEEEKAEYLEARPMDPIRIGTGFFSVADGVRYWRDYLKMFAHPELHCPAKPPKLRYWHKCQSVHRAVSSFLLSQQLLVQRSRGCQGRCCRVLGEDERPAAGARQGNLRELGPRRRSNSGGHGPRVVLPDSRRQPLPAVHRSGRRGPGAARALRPRLPHPALPERRRRAPGRARRAVAPRQAPPWRVLRHRRRPAGGKKNTSSCPFTAMNTPARHAMYVCDCACRS